MIFWVSGAASLGQQEQQIDVRSGRQHAAAVAAHRHDRRPRRGRQAADGNSAPPSRGSRGSDCPRDRRGASRRRVPCRPPRARGAPSARPCSSRSPNSSTASAAERRVVRSADRGAAPPARSSRRARSKPPFGAAARGRRARRTAAGEVSMARALALKRRSEACAANARRLASITSQIAAARSGPPSRWIARRCRSAR